MPISLTIAAGAALLNIWIAMRVGRVRGEAKVSIGDGGDERLIRRMRAHSNYVENTPFVLILLALVELSTGSSIWLWAVGALYLVARILHAIGMDGLGWARGAGITVTMLIQLGLAVAALLTVYLTPTSISSTLTDTVAVESE
ncbi:MAPEG family protein [Sphingopyxis sp. MG]|nr:GST-like protein [Sphingopyxis granuli]AVA15948.1 MAPEG family protein [Sphingopyxis sp. MG]ODU28739.1 MAG: GST-like protein [Sphingopyxis sp. SCN 67-31]